MSHHHHIPPGSPPPQGSGDEFVIVRQTWSPSSSSLLLPPSSFRQGQHNGKSEIMPINDRCNDDHADHDHSNDQSQAPLSSSSSSSRQLNLANKHSHFVKKLPSSSPASADRPLLLHQLISSSGAAKTTAEQQQNQCQQRSDAKGTSSRSAPFWTRRPMFTAIFITLLIGTFSLVNSFSNNGKSDGSTDDLLGEDDDGITQLISDNDAKGYLDRFGYLDSTPSITSSQEEAPAATDRGDGADQARVYAQQQQPKSDADLIGGDFTLDSIRSAVRKFQEFAGLPTTGDLDNRTRKKMAQPRCGIQDVQMLTRGDHAMKWRKRRVTYQLMQPTNDIPARMQKQAIQMAFDTWSKIVPLDFGEATGYDTPDVKVLFARRSHGDPWPFDGRGGVLAHATFPQDGKLHFDDDENWVFMDGQKIGSHRFTDLYWVALHEIGHVLGLSHSNIETAIMAPFYQDPRNLVDWRGNYKQPALTQDDVRAAQQIYGKRYGRFDTSASSRERLGETVPPTGGGRRKSTAGGGEGSFWSKFGKMFSSNDDDNNANNNHDDGRHTHRSNGRTHARRDHHHHLQHSHNNEKEYDEMDNSAPAEHFAKFKFSILFLAPLISISVFSRIMLIT